MTAAIKRPEPTLKTVWLVIQEISNVEMLAVCSAHSTATAAAKECLRRRNLESPASNMIYYVLDMKLDPETPK